MRLVLVKCVVVGKTIAVSEQSFDTERARFTLLVTGSLPLPLFHAFLNFPRHCVHFPLTVALLSLQKCDVSPAFLRHSPSIPSIAP
jgi:hypothetical protein